MSLIVAALEKFPESEVVDDGLMEFLKQNLEQFKLKRWLDKMEEIYDKVSFALKYRSMVRIND